MRRIGMQLIQEKKAEIMRERAGRKEKEAAFDGIERRDLRSRDLLTLLIKANMATDIPENQRLSDEDVLAREWNEICVERLSLTVYFVYHRGSNVSSGYK